MDDLKFVSITILCGALLDLHFLGGAFWVVSMVLKTELGIKRFFLISGSTPVFAMFLTSFGGFNRTRQATDSTGRTGRSGLVFKTMVVRLPSKVFARTTALGKIMMVDNL